MSIGGNSPDKNFQMVKIAVGGVIVVGLGAARILWSFRPTKPMAVEESVDFNRYLGLWYEIARKPVDIEQRSFKNITFEYLEYREDKFDIDIHYQTKEGRLGQLYSHAKLRNAPKNNGFAVKYLPGLLRNIKTARYEFIRLDPDYQIALVGNRERTHLWLLSRTPKLDSRIVDDYLSYAQEQGFSLKNIIYVKHDD